MIPMSLTDPTFYARHSADDLRDIVARYTASSLAMAATAPALSDEAMSIANAAWAALVARP